MGWTFTTNPTSLSPVEYIKQNCWRGAAEQGYALIESGQAGEYCYFALKISQPDEWSLKTYEPSPDGSITVALVYMVKGGNGAPFGYKDMDESMGPYDDGRCPKAVLCLLSPLKAGQGEWNRNWRERQKDRAAIGQLALI